MKHKKKWNGFDKFDERKIMYKIRGVLLVFRWRVRVYVSSTVVHWKASFETCNVFEPPPPPLCAS